MSWIGWRRTGASKLTAQSVTPSADGGVWPTMNAGCARLNSRSSATLLSAVVTVSGLSKLTVTGTVRLPLVP